MPGGLGGIYPAMANSVLALRLLGYPDDHPLVAGQLKEIEALAVEDARRAPLPAVPVAGLGHVRWPSTRWSRATCRADHPALVSAPATG